MAYYSNLVAVWNSVTQPPSGVTGTALTGLTTAQKLAAINGWTVTGSVPTNFYVTGSQIANCFDKTEFLALTQQQQTELLEMCDIQGPLLGGSANTSKLVDGLILSYFTNLAGPTIAALTALAQATSQSWWVVDGYTSPIGSADLIAAASANSGVALS